jgi:NAD-dependent SIR2 family protein deacetylase
LKGKEYFVITSEPDNLLVENGFPIERIFETEGNYSKFQCEGKCDGYTFPNRDLVEKMMESQGFELGPVGNMYIPDGVVSKTRIASDLVPVCPVCGGRVSPHISLDNKLVQDDDYFIMNLLYDNFLKEHEDENILFLELGVEREYAEDIRIPFWNMAGSNLKAVYASINLDGTYYPSNMKERSILIEGDIRTVIKDLSQDSSNTFPVK